MSSEFRMPSLGADMEAGTLVEWLVKPGDAVRRGQVVAVVETDKGAIEIESWQAGEVERIVVQPGAKVPVGAVLALFGGGDAAAPAQQPPAVSSAPPVSPVTPSASPAAPAPRVGGARLKISPAARRLAEERGVDPATVTPAAADGIITREDIERAAAAAAAAPVAVTTPAAAPRPAASGEWHTQMRRAIAAAMSKSKREIPHYYLATDIDVSPLLDWLTQENLRRDVAHRLLPAVPLMKAVALALVEVPELNGFWTDNAFRPATGVHLGMAIAMRGGGLVAPAIHDVQALGLDDLMARLHDLITRVRGGRLRSSELADPTVTLTSLGDQGVERVYGVIYPPQVAIVGLGRITERAWVENGAVVPRRVLTASLAADHRASDGHRGGLFLSALARLLRNPEKLA